MMFSCTMLIYFLIPDTQSAKASRQQLKEAIYASLFDMNVPAVCAVNQVIHVYASLFVGT